MTELIGSVPWQWYALGAVILLSVGLYIFIKRTESDPSGGGLVFELSLDGDGDGSCGDGGGDGGGGD